MESDSEEERFQLPYDPGDLRVLLQSDYEDQEQDATSTPDKVLQNEKYFIKNFLDSFRFH